MIVRGASDRANRVGLAIVGIVLLAAGVYGLVRGFGGFGSDQAHDVLLTPSVRRFVHDHADWFWAVALVVAGLIAYVGYRWLRGQLPTTGRSQILTLDGGADGEPPIELRAAALAGALADDVERHPDVSAAAARVEPGTPLIVDIRVDVEDGAHLEPVRTFVAGEALPRLRQALDVGDDAVDARLHVRIADGATRHLN